MPKPTILAFKINAGELPNAAAWLDKEGCRHQIPICNKRLDYQDIIAANFGSEVGDEFEVLVYDENADPSGALPTEVVRYTRPKLAVDGPFYLVRQCHGLAVRNAKHQCVGVLEWKDGRRMSPMEIEEFIRQVTLGAQHG